MSAAHAAQLLGLAIATVVVVLGLVYGACRAVYGAAHHADEAAGRRRRRRAARIERRNARAELAHVKHIAQPSLAAGEAFGTAGSPQELPLPHRDPRHLQHGSTPPRLRRVPRTPTRVELDGVLFEAHQILEEEQEGGQQDG